MGILELFGIQQKVERAEETLTPSETIRKITQALEEMDPEQAKYLAAFAYVLGRVAHADLHVSEQETREMERIIQGVAGLPEEQAILVAQIAKSQNVLFGSTENFIVTREFAKIASRAQKVALLNCLFAVSSSDRSISTVEDNEIRRVSKELGLDHRDFIAARSAYKEHLEVLKKRPDG